MIDKHKYSVSDLSGLVGVPRTTINDWLIRYSQYIEFLKQGKRKIYLQRTLDILTEVAQLRAEGMSSFDIEDELASRHPIHGELTETSREVSRSQESTTNEVVMSEQYSIILKQQTDEIDGLMRGQLQNMSNKLDDIEDHNKTLNSKAARWFSFAIFLVMILFLVGVVAAVKIERGKQDKKILEEQFSGKLNDFTETICDKDLEIDGFKVQSVLLKKGADGLKKELKELNLNMDAQKKEFELFLKQSLKDIEKNKSAEIFKMRDGFAKERLDALKKLDVTKNVNKEQEKVVTKLQDQSFKQSASINDLLKKLEKMNKAIEIEKLELEKLKSEKDKLLKDRNTLAPNMYL